MVRSGQDAGGGGQSAPEALLSGPLQETSNSSPRPPSACPTVMGPVSSRSGEAVEQPGRPDGPSRLRDPRGEQAVGGDDRDVVSSVRGLVRLPHRLCVAGPPCVHGGHVPVPADGYAALRLAFEDQDGVAVDVGGDQLLMEPASGAGTVLPPAVGTRADDVGTVDDQHAHLRYFEKSWGRSR